MSVLFLFFLHKIPYVILLSLPFSINLTISPCSLEALICLSLILQILDVITFSFICALMFQSPSPSAAAKSLQSCPTLCDPIDGSPPGSPVPEILQARTLEWVAISFSSAWKWEVKVKSLSRVRPSATPWTVAFQAPPSMGFSRQEYWSGVPLPFPSKCPQNNSAEKSFLP